MRSAIRALPVIALSLAVPVSAIVAGTPAPAILSTGAERALVISPHPDDGTLAAAGLMQRIIAGGGSVHVVQMTGGDAFPRGVTTLRPGIHATPVAYRWYATVREREALHALHRLGVGRSRIRLLGFPDEGLCLVAGRDPSAPPFMSPYTQRESPPPSEQLIPGAMYRHADLLHELTELIRELHPTLIVLPHCGDEHPDHCATHLLVHQAMLAAVPAHVHPPRVLHYILHYPQWPAAGSIEQPIEPPVFGHAREWDWKTLPLTGAERAAKRHALAAYRSQMLVMADFLGAFDRPNELFIEGEPAAAFPCWCNGENISTAAGGVP
jgi:LmbE family N-acetylglucosaminyl deacetylase